MPNRELREFAIFVKNILDDAYGGVKYWSESDAFEPIYEKIEEILGEDPE